MEATAAMDGRAASDGRPGEAPGLTGWPAAADAELAVAVAERAAELLRTVRRSGGTDLGATGDRQSHELIVEALRQVRPDDAIRSEEAPSDEPGVSGRLWIVDPLDGTREFAEGLAEFAVHVALVVQGEAVLGTVALPGLGAVLCSADPPALVPWSGAAPRLAVSRSRPPAAAGAVAEALRAELVPMGSAGFKVAAVVRGEVDAYVHAGGQYEWDSAAPVAVALAAGLHASRIDGSPLRYGRPDPWLPDLVVCRPELRDDVLAALAPFSDGA
jgi:3'(2'), 5'-bisphosphate nucleotidase